MRPLLVSCLSLRTFFLSWCTNRFLRRVIAKELVYEIAEFLTRRYPEVYSAKRHPPVANDFGWYGDGQIKEVTINPLGVTHNLDNEDPMTVAGLL